LKAFRAAFALACCVSAFAVSARAQAMYTYTGNNFFSATGIVSTADHITVALTFSSALPPNCRIGEIDVAEQPCLSGIFLSAWTMSDGITTLIFPYTAGSFPTMNYELTTDADGDISYWSISASTPAVAMETCYLIVSPAPCGDSSTYSNGSGTTLGPGGLHGPTPAVPEGTWTSTTTQPAPKLNTSVTLTASLNPLPPGSSEDFIVNVVPSSATGTITLFDQGSQIAAPTTLSNNASATIPVSNLSAGSHSIAAVYSGDVNYNGSTSLPLLLVVEPSPTIAATVNAASYGIVAAGGLATLFGSFPGLPTEALTIPGMIDSVSVFVDSSAAPLYFTSPSQINFQVPWSTENNATVQVSNGTWSVSTFDVTIAPAAPGIFEMNAAHQGAILDTSYHLVSSSNPVSPGETILIYCTGLGPVSPSQTDGTPAPTDTLVTTMLIPQVTIGGEAASVSWSGLAPGFVGLYQVNAAVPMDLPSETAQVSIGMSGITSNIVTLAVQ
jgi:uncharacterized protein (TIGR03437 family)